MSAEKMCHEEVFINLNVLSKINPGDKLEQTTKSLLNIDTSYFPFVSRWWKGAGRMDTLAFINQVLTRAFEMNEEWAGDKCASHSLFRLTADLKTALNGLNNLKQTYHDDKLVQSEIDVMMENIRTRLYANYHV